jgi:uncharacterized protein (DUF697 family)
MITTQAELEAVRAQCRRLVRNRSLISAGVAVVPVPALDVLTDLGLMRQMLPEISRRFGLDAAQVAALDPQRAQRVMAVANRVGSAVIGRVVTERLVASLLRRLGLRFATVSVAKFVPLVGSALAAGVSFGAMKLLGERHINDCFETARQSLLSPA